MGYLIKEHSEVCKEFRRIFHLDFADYYDKVLTLFIFYEWKVDLFKFENWLRKRFPKESEDTSIRDIVERHYGKEGLELIEKLL